jgi:hypothetical protein
MNVALSFAKKHNIDKFLTCVPMLIEQSVSLEVHIGSDIINASCKNDRIYQQDNTVAIFTHECVVEVKLDHVEDQRVVSAGIQLDLGALHG